LPNRALLRDDLLFDTDEADTVPQYVEVDLKAVRVERTRLFLEKRFSHLVAEICACCFSACGSPVASFIPEKLDLRFSPP
jgi:hypothetical protein